jgi:hypothetical protein
MNLLSLRLRTPPYKYWMRTDPIFGERLRRFGRKKSPG